MKILFLSLWFLSEICLANAKMPFSLPEKHPVVGTYNSTEHPAKVYVVEAYFNGCHYCNENAPQVRELAAKYMGRGVEVLDVSVDRSPSEFDAWIRNTKPNHPVLDDNRRLLLWGELGARSFPTTYVIDGMGKVLFKHVGVFEDLNEISQIIDMSLNLLDKEVQ